VTADADYSNHRWTVDTAEDMEFVRAIFARLNDRAFRSRDVFDLLDHEPELMELNRSIMQKALHEG
jgi:spore coat polysaccharide biosynthesis protein SpsF